MSNAIRLKGELSISSIKKIAEIVSKSTGVQLGEKQMHMVSNRIKKRLFDLKIDTEDEYLDYLQSNMAQETTALISLLTTHHTYFFREFSHFEYLERVAIPDLIEAKRKSGSKEIKIWSAACSHGQEAYSLAIFVKDILSKLAPEFTFEVFGSDVDQESIRISKNGVYPKKEIQEIPLNLIKGNFQIGTNEIKNFIKVKDSIKMRCKFEVANLIDIPKSVVDQKFDIIFCRNVFIYFSIEQTKEVVRNLTNCLSEKGYFFIGISESLHGLDLKLNFCGPSIYRIMQHEVSEIKSKASLRVLCVDDSSTIITLLKKILAPNYGFTIADTAKDGLEAAEKIKKNAYDVITLDIHMPNQNGLDFLKLNKVHPPVVILSSVSRDDITLATECFNHGAVDYIEKPTLNNLEIRADEIRMKIKYAIYSSKEKFKPIDQEREFQKKLPTIMNPDTKLRILLVDFPSYKKVVSFLKEGVDQKLPTVVLMENSESAILTLMNKLKNEELNTTMEVHNESNLTNINFDKLVFMSTQHFFKEVKNKIDYDNTSISIFGPVSTSTYKQLSQLRNVQILIDEGVVSNSNRSIKEIATDIVPSTSFHYLCCKYFSNNKDKT